MVKRKQRARVREGTKRAKVIALMQRRGGATLQQICRATKWDRKTSVDCIRLVRVANKLPVRFVGDRYSLKVAKRRARPSAKRPAAPGSEASA